MKDYKQLYLKTFFFWQEAYEKLYRQLKELEQKLKELEKNDKPTLD